MRRLPGVRSRIERISPDEHPPHGQVSPPVLPGVGSPKESTALLRRTVLQGARRVFRHRGPLQLLKGREIGSLTGALLAALILVVSIPRAVAQEQPADATKLEVLPPLVIIDSTPVPALGTPVEKYAGNVQSIQAKEIDNQNLLDLSGMLYRNFGSVNRSEEHTSELQSRLHLVCRLLLEKKKKNTITL